MNLFKATLLLWFVLGLLVSNGLAAPDRTPPPPGPTPHRAPPAQPHKHRAPPASPNPHPANPHPPGPKLPPPTPASPNPPPGHPSHPGNKHWWGKLADPGFWLDRLGHPETYHPEPCHPEPYHPEPYHPEPYHPEPYHPEPYHPEDPRPPEPVDPDWRPEEPGWRPQEMPAAAPPELLNESGLTVRCYINGGLVSLSPGRAIPLEPGRPSIIEFHRGGNSAMAQYELTHGVHKFVRTGYGWELVPVGH